MSTPLSVSGLFDILPLTHTVGLLDWNLGFFNIFLTTLVLVTPCTPGWKFFRIAVATPIVAGIWLYVVLTPLNPNDTDQWGVPTLMISFFLRTLEWFVFFPAEEHCHRLRPRSQVRSSHLTDTPAHNGHSVDGKEENHNEGSEALVPEPVPPPFTWAKFYWACSLWWSWRGIGWNFCCPLSSSARQHPYTRTSSRRSFFITKVRSYIICWITHDVVRTYMNTTSASVYFSGQPGYAPLYSSLSTGERALYSTAVVVRVWFSLVRSHIEASVICVALGGWMGWEGEIWSPWGWPSLFGSLGDLWRHPGLSTMWSRTWQGYNRRFLYVFGWIGIGENILGLTHTGISSHPRAPLQSSATSSRNSPSPSGSVSPSHPLPSGAADSLPTRKVSLRLMIQNLVKSFIVFGLSGLVHEFSSVMLLVKYPPVGKDIGIRDILVCTPFFVIQPIGLAVEAGIKSAWRGWKVKQHPEWKKSGKGNREPAWLIFAERAVGFAWTWIWLGWTAGWFVEGVTKLREFRRDAGNPLFPSLVGGLYAGKWFH